MTKGFFSFFFSTGSFEYQLNYQPLRRNASLILILRCILFMIHIFFYLQDRHIKRNGDIEPFMDPSQDYQLLLGYENATHTVMRFKRKLDTCDTSHDLPITVSRYNK